MLLDGQALDLHRRALGIEIGAVVRKDLVSAQPAEVVVPHQKRKVGEALDEALVVLSLLHHQTSDTQPESGIGGRPDGDPVVGLGRGRPVLRGNDDDLAAALHALDEPVRVRELVLHQVLAVHDDELRVAQIVEIAVGGLDPVHPGVTRRLVAVPGVVRPGATGTGLVGPYAADLGVEQGERIAETVHAVFPQHAQEPHTAAHLDRARPRPAHGFHHLGLVTLLEKALSPFLSAVATGNSVERQGDLLERLLPRDLDEFVVAPAVEHVLGLELGGELGEASIGPRFPTAAHNRVTQAVRTVDHPVKGVALGALTWVPIGSGMVAVEVGVVLIVVGRAAADDDAVADVSADTAGVGVVGRADPVEGAIVAVLVVVDALRRRSMVACEKLFSSVI
jgi:hypothetical protein